MKSILFLLILIIGVAPACKTAKKRKARAVKVERSIEGNWELTYITAGEDLFSFEELYPDKKPWLKFDLRENQVSGNTGCNSFFGELRIRDKEIYFGESMTMTKMLCEGAGEERFLSQLREVDSYSISEDNVLALMKGDVAILRFRKL